MKSFICSPKKTNHLGATYPVNFITAFQQEKKSKPVHQFLHGFQVKTQEHMLIVGERIVNQSYTFH
jgi:hypothetical protein